MPHPSARVLRSASLETPVLPARDASPVPHVSPRPSARAAPQALREAVARVVWNHHTECDFACAGSPNGRYRPLFAFRRSRATSGSGPPFGGANSQLWGNVFHRSSSSFIGSCSQRQVPQGDARCKGNRSGPCLLQRLRCPEVPARSGPRSWRMLAARSLVGICLAEWNIVSSPLSTRRIPRVSRDHPVESRPMVGALAGAVLDSSPAQGVGRRGRRGGTLTRPHP